MRIKDIDGGHEFDFGRTSENYAAYRDIYPESMYQKLTELGIGREGQRVLDLGSGTAVLPMNMYGTGASFTATDISAEQVEYGRRLAKERGMERVSFKVCGAEDTGFESGSFDAVTAVQCFQYFDAEKAAQEICRVLRPNGLFCKIFMDWLPYEDEVIAEMESLVMRYNPGWNGGGFREFVYSFPEWARGLFELVSVDSYDAVLEFTKEAWLGRVMTCRGVGASLSDDESGEFKAEYSALLDKYSEPLRLKHQIHIELYKKL